MKNLFNLTFVSLLFAGPLCAATAKKAPSTSMKSKAPADVPMLPDSEAEAVDRDIASTDMNRVPTQDRQEGWIVRQTENGMVKVPAKQYFRFDGAALSGKAYTPFQAVFDQRPARKNKSLIPVRTSFKREVLDASGYSGR